MASSARAGDRRAPVLDLQPAANPDRIEVEIQGRNAAVTAETLSGKERRPLERITTMQPRFAAMSRRPTAVAVVRLTAR